MSEWVFACDYCGERVPTDWAVTYWTPVDQLPDGRTLALAATFCCDHCGKQATTRSGTTRG